MRDVRTVYLSAELSANSVDLGGGGGDGLADGGVDGVPKGAGGGLGGGQIQSHALGGPSVDQDPSERVHESNHADATENIYLMSVTELVSHPEMSALNADAP